MGWAQVKPHHNNGHLSASVRACVCPCLTESIA
nr:MAG TPA: hypothetical protein [Caudoviricetes sp.]